MTNEQIQLVKKTWRVFRGISPITVGDLFYSKLFTDNPALRKMFPANMEQQYQKLIDMLNAIVIRLDKLDELAEDIAAMAQRHVQYGVRPAHYKLVGAALLWTLQKGLGNDWTAEVKNAWTTCYTLLANTMIKSSSSFSEKNG
jgi:hemoglobin-like flavoprotein